jgi:subtilisin family serine protease
VRVLDCNGNGTTAGVIAGVDWVTANHQKPAVANMSLGGGTSVTLDAAVNNSVAAGVFYAVAAGNELTDACLRSPARAARAYTVASTTITDSRSTTFSNFGLCVKIFAPGSGITSAWHTSDSATNTISGTSMASPHVAGAAALILDERPGLSPEQVVNLLTDRATCDVVANRGTGSPNKLLYTLTGSPAGCAATCDVTTLAGGSVGGTETHRACRSVRGGSSLTVAGGGSLTIEAGATVALSDGFKVESGGQLTVRTCAHSLCQTGVRLTTGCHDCVSTICAADPFCCNTEWDAICVARVATDCGLTCP